MASSAWKREKYERLREKTEKVMWQVAPVGREERKRYMNVERSMREKTRTVT